MGTSLTDEGVLIDDDDPDDDALTAVLAGLPQHGVVALNGDGSFLYQPQGDFVGVDEFSYQATDGELTSEVATVTITVDRALAEQSTPDRVRIIRRRAGSSARL